MARDPFAWMTYKSKAQQKEEQDAYAAWAFPYGQRQKEMLRDLLTELLPKEGATLAMTTFLVGKEAFCGKESKNPDPGRNPLADAKEALERSGLRPKKRDLPLYLALILADSQVDENLRYPDAVQLRAAAEGLGERRNCRWKPGR